MDWALEVLEETPSTQDLVKRMAEQGAQEGLCVQALRQGAGYGRHGRPWISLEGNLFLSFILRPQCTAQRAGLLALVTGQALVETVQPYLTDQNAVSIKMPNDVLLAGQKCAGVLIESHLGEAGEAQWVVVGVGVNISRAPEGPFAAVQEFSNEALDVYVFRDSFLKNMAKSYSQWQKAEFGSISAQKQG